MSLKSAVIFTSLFFKDEGDASCTCSSSRRRLSPLQKLVSWVKAKSWADSIMEHDTTIPLSLPCNGVLHGSICFLVHRALDIKVVVVRHVRPRGMHLPREYW